MSESNHRWFYILVKAQVSLLSAEEGGRSQFISEKYRYSPNHMFKNGLFFMGVLKKIEGEILQPGASAVVEILFGVIEPFASFIAPEAKWEIFEGSKKVGTGEVLSILEQRIEAADAPSIVRRYDPI